MKQREIFLFLILIFATHTLISQTDFRPGYILTLSGDTIPGEIDYRGDLSMSKVCKFKNNAGALSEYTPDDISGYRFIGSKYYESREVKRKNVFLEFLIKGEVNIYYMRDEIGDHYFIDKANEKLVELPYEEGLTYEGDKQVIYKSKEHIGLLNFYMQDAFEFLPRIQSLGKPSHRNLIKLAEDYHNTVCLDEACIIYEKSTPFLKINFEILAGILTDGNNKQQYIQGGVLAHLWVPRTNEKVFVKTGFLYSPREITVDEDRQLNIPLHIGYLAPSTYRIRPSFSVGLISPSYSAGVALRVGDHINIGIQGWANFYFDAVPWVPQRLKYHSILGSLYIAL